MNNDYVEVDFSKYCPFCRFMDLNDNQDPCNDCLAQGYNNQSEKPINYKKADNL